MKQIFPRMSRGIPTSNNEKDESINQQNPLEKTAVVLTDDNSNLREIAENETENEMDLNDEAVPPNCGIIIHLQSNLNDDEEGGGKVSVKVVPDKHYPNIHPNCYAPASLTDVRLLKGGGSGTAVFHGYDEELHSMVLKHGGAKDTNEVFSLVTISRQLYLRSHRQSASDDGRRDAVSAAKDMEKRIPEFVMVYISPNHVRDRAVELWAQMRGSDMFTEKRSLNYIPSIRDLDESSALGSNRSIEPEGENCGAADDQTPSSPLRPRRSLPEGSVPEQSPKQRPRMSREHRSSLAGVRDTLRSRRLSLVRGNRFSIDVKNGQVSFAFPGLQPDGSISLASANDSRAEVDGPHMILEKFAETLAIQQEKNKWKVSLAQKTIGGKNAENGAVVYTSGKLQGELLTELINEFCEVMNDLKVLTLPEEKGGLESVKRELEQLRESRDVSSVSKMTDSFVGSAIKKNFAPGVGRFASLRKFGKNFRAISSETNELWLTENEEIPTKYLGLILEEKVAPSSVFQDPPFRECALDIVEGSWLETIEQAVSMETPSAVEQIWSCGLSDAGLHNTFISMDRGLELFDLGEPRLMSQPSFLTKFLMSFFHTFGMEEANDHTWVNRFLIAGDKVCLTKETAEKIPYAYEAFDTASDQLIKVVLEGDEKVKLLLVRYVVLQLLSDASFCLARWEMKGGGSERYGARACDCLEKWLWRSLWDVYIASHVSSKFGLK